MQPLIDADVLCYELGFAAETGWRGEDTPPFDYVQEMLDTRISNICARVGATTDPVLFLTGKTNFRNDIAKRVPYKSRPSHKPFHYHNIKAYIKGKYDYRISEGLEADDLLAIEQTRALQQFYGGNRKEDELTVICTRDKDLRQVPGWQFGWELSNQPEFALEFVEGLGYIKLNKKRNKVSGVGPLFFYSQMLTGDAVDSIPGCPNCGPVKAYEILADCTTEKDALQRVYIQYKKQFGMGGYAEMIEQGRLLHMTRHIREDGSPVLWGQSQ